MNFYHFKQITLKLTWSGCWICQFYIYIYIEIYAQIIDDCQFDYKSRLANDQLFCFV